LDPRGLHLEAAVEIAARLNLQWIAVECDWAQGWPTPEAVFPPVELHEAMVLARSRALPVVVMVTNAPGWARDGAGPDPEITAELVARLVDRYPQIGAVELFPGANTIQGWGAAPDPAAYARLLQESHQALEASGAATGLIAGGLIPSSDDSTGEVMEDTPFLEGLYQQGAEEFVAAFSLQFPEITGDPLRPPSSSEARVLRRYEKIRAVMLANQHPQGILWITSLSWPSGKIALDDGRYGDPRQQARWLHQAYRLLSAQLYIGAVFIARLNPTWPDLGAPSSLILHDTGLHPLLPELGRMASPNGRPSQIAWTTTPIKRIYFPKSNFKFLPE
jgi:hypothetical protein